MKHFLLVKYLSVKDRGVGLGELGRDFRWQCGSGNSPEREEGLGERRLSLWFHTEKVSARPTRGSGPKAVGGGVPR